jgi:N-acetylmuramoyl-L-alanine amidase
MAKLALNYGHGANTWEDKRSKGLVVNGKVYEEHTFNAAVGEKVRKIVEAHGVTVKVIQPPMGKDIPLSQRTDAANTWGADLWLGIHANAAADKEADGVCAFYWGTSADGKRAADAYVKYAKAEGFPLYHGGLWGSVKGTWNAFHELEETEMAAILSENGFMTNPDDFKGIFLNEDDYHDRIARVNARMVLDYFKIKYDSNKDITVPKPKPVTRQVRVVLETNNVNAARLITEFKKRGYTARMEEIE